MSLRFWRFRLVRARAWGRPAPCPQHLWSPFRQSWLPARRCSAALQQSRALATAPPRAETLRARLALSLCLWSTPVLLSPTALSLEGLVGQQPRHGHGLAEHKQGLDTGAGFLEQMGAWLTWLCFLHALPPACSWVATTSCQAQDMHLEHLSLPAKLSLFSVHQGRCLHCAIAIPLVILTTLHPEMTIQHISKLAFLLKSIKEKSHGTKLFGGSFVTNSLLEKPFKRPLTTAIDSITARVIYGVNQLSHSRKPWLCAVLPESQPHVNKN